jgi:hypothetical protein
MVTLVSSTLAVGVQVLRYHLNKQQQPNSSGPSPQQPPGLLPQSP